MHARAVDSRFTATVSLMLVLLRHSAQRLQIFQTAPDESGLAVRQVVSRRELSNEFGDSAQVVSRSGWEKVVLYVRVQASPQPAEEGTSCFVPGTAELRLDKAGCF